MDNRAKAFGVTVLDTLRCEAAGKWMAEHEIASINFMDRDAVSLGLEWLAATGQVQRSRGIAKAAA
jgi:hypothetical protein